MIKARALWDFNASDADEISFKKGECGFVVVMHVFDECRDLTQMMFLSFMNRCAS